MRFEGRHTLGLSPEELFPRLLDPEVLRRCIPGCEELVRTAEGVYQARLTVKMGPVRGAFRGTIRLVDVEPPRAYTLLLHGEGMMGFLDGRTRVTLEPREGGCTEIRYESEVQVGGLLAGVGARLIPGAARAYSEEFFELVEQAIRQAPPCSPPLSQPPPPGPPLPPAPPPP